MGRTLKQLRDEIYADFPQIRQNPDFPIARLNQWLNEAVSFVQVELNGLGMKAWEASQTLTLTGDQIGRTPVKKAPVPSDILESPDAIIMVDCSLPTGLTTYILSVSGITSSPTIGSVYVNGGYQYTVIAEYLAGTAPSISGALIVTGTVAPPQTGTIVLSSGAGDATITYSAYSILANPGGVAVGPGVDPRMLQDNMDNGYWYANQLRPQFFRLANYIYIVPSSISSATIYYLRALPSMVNDGDVCGIPTAFQHFVIWQAENFVKEKLGFVQSIEDESAKVAAQLAEQFQKMAGIKAVRQEQMQPKKGEPLQ